MKVSLIWCAFGKDAILKFPPFDSKSHGIFVFHSWIVLHCVDAHYFFPFFSQGTSRLTQFSCSYDLSCCEHSSARVFGECWSIVCVYTKDGIAGFWGSTLLSFLRKWQVDFHRGFSKHAFPPTMSRWSRFSTSLPACAIYWAFGLTHSGW